MTNRGGPVIAVSSRFHILFLLRGSRRDLGCDSSLVFPSRSFSLLATSDAPSHRLVSSSESRMSSLPPRLLAVYRPFRCNRPASRYSHAATPGAILRRRTQPPVSILICCARGSSNYSGLAAVVFVLSLLSARSLRSVHPFRSLRLVRRIERPKCSDVIALSRTAPVARR